MAKFHPEDRRCLLHFHPCNDILMRLYEIFETGKKQDLTPFILTNTNEIIPVSSRGAKKIPSLCSEIATPFQGSQ